MLDGSRYYNSYVEDNDQICLAHIVVAFVGHHVNLVIQSKVEPILPTISKVRCAPSQEFCHEAIQCPNNNPSQGDTKENCGNIEKVVYEPPPECLYFGEEG